jgi:endonuclease/exonuclease/phosphatase family metal-dependent hydrolase
MVQQCRPVEALGDVMPWLRVGVGMGLTVATFNLRHDADEWVRRAPLIVAELGSLKPHMIALQEICLPIGQARWLAGALNGQQGAGEQPYECVERRQWPAGTMPDERGVAILCRLPIIAGEGVDLPHGGRVALAVCAAWQDCMIRFVCTHLHHEAPDDAVRREEVRAMHDWLDERAPEPTGDEPTLTGLAGDFNATPETGAGRDHSARWRSAYAAANGAEPEWTYGTPLADRNNQARGRDPWRGTLDYIFVPPAATVLASRLVCNRPAPDDPALYPSDHVGVWAEIEAT